MAKAAAKRKTAEPAPPAREKLAVKYLPIDDLIPYARNSRTHSAEQVAQIAASIKEFGFTNPILLDGEKGIIAGHGRVLGARELGMTTVPTIELSHLSEAQKRAYIIADNKLALNAGWDNELLKLELDDLDGEDFDLALLGFSDDELDVLRNGWDSDIDPTEKDGENLDGIAASIKVLVDQDCEDRAKKLIAQALGNAGITYEIG